MTHIDAFDIGVDLVSAVTPDYSVDTSRFSGKIDEVIVTIDPL
jgi:hypothetical protein